MNSNGNTSLWASSLVFALLLLGVFAFLNATNRHPTANTSRLTNTPQASSSLAAYSAKSGDTLSSISAKTGVPLNELEAANPQIGDKSLIYPGEAIKLPPSIPVTGGSVQIPVDPYTVRLGDTLFSLAARVHTTVDALLRANPQITNPRLIFPGQQLTIP